MIATRPTVSHKECELIIQSARRGSGKRNSVPRGEHAAKTPKCKLNSPQYAKNTSISAPGVENAIETPKRMLGRPRKYPKITSISVPGVEKTTETPKRMLGRPRKYPKNTSISVPGVEKTTETPKRTLGRPRKYLKIGNSVDIENSDIVTKDAMNGRTTRQTTHSLLCHVDSIEPGKQSKTGQRLRGRPHTRPLVREPINLTDNTSTDQHPGGHTFDSLAEAYQPAFEELARVDDQNDEDSFSEDASISLIEGTYDCPQ